MSTYTPEALITHYFSYKCKNSEVYWSFIDIIDFYKVKGIEYKLTIYRPIYDLGWYESLKCLQNRAQITYNNTPLLLPAVCGVCGR